MSELPGPQAKLTRIDWIIAAALVVLVVATRIPFIPPVIADSDGAEYAFALEKFDMAHGYPHAPGYPLFILCAKPIYALTGNASISLAAVNVGFSGLACGALYILGTVLFGGWVGLAAALLLCFDSNFWRFGVLCMPYPAGVFWGIVVGLTAYQAGTGRRWGLISAVALGLGGGFRQQVLTFLSPMWLWCCRKLGWKQIGLGVLIIAVLTGAWIAGVSWATGGYSVYQASNQAQWGEAIYPSSVFIALNGGLRAGVEQLVKRLSSWSQLLWGGHSHLSVLAWALPCLYAFGRLFRPQLIRSDERVQLIVAWLVPMLAFHILIHMNNRGHALTYMPVVCLVGGLGIYLFCADLTQAAGWRLDGPTVRTGMVAILILSVALNIGIFTLRTAPADKQQAREVGSVIEYIASNYAPEQTAIVQSDSRMFYHAVHYHLRDYPGYLLQQTLSPPRPSLAFPSSVRLDDSIKQVIFLNPQARVQAPTQMVNLASGAAVKMVELSGEQRYMHFGADGVWFLATKSRGEG